MEREKNKSALIVDSSEVNRVVLRDLLQGELDISEAASVDEAIAVLQRREPKIDLVLLDVVLPQRSGFELISWMRENRYLDETPVVVVSAESADAFVDRAFALGAMDYIHRPFASRLLVRRVMSAVSFSAYYKKQEHRIDRYAAEPDVDEMTGLLTKNAFFERAAQYVADRAGESLCMAAADLDHFTLYNQFFGREAGDRYIKFVAAYLKSCVKRYGGVAGYPGADSFYYVCPDREEIFSTIQEKIRTELRLRDLEIGYAPKIGVYRIEDDSKTILDACDCANTALASAQKDYSQLISWYDGTMENRNDEFRILREVEAGLKNHEFTAFLQPKCNMLNGKVVGSEALVRWIQRDGKMISPGVFIPVLENNGFVSKVDSAVWEDVCRWQRFCIDMDYPLLPVSINISRTDFYTMDVCGFLENLLSQYDLPREALELEITESSYAGGNQSLQGEIAKLKARGFKILMDDFGSGYSSLNSLKEFDIDILKFDMRFLKMDAGNREKGIDILETIVNLAHAMQLPVVVEGVETQEQVKLLTSINCVYAQGYYYYKPLSKNDFERLLEDESKLDLRGIRLRASQTHLMEFTDEALFTDEMIDNILGAIAFYEVKGNSVRLVRLNRHYYSMMGMSDVMSDPDYAIHLKKNIHREDRDRFFALFDQADERGRRGATADVRCIRKEGGFQWIRLRVFPLRSGENSRLYYASLEDVSDLYEMREAR